uniref:Uncharacterized protein n=1 Tax=Romanomermis culicivorax TaxID=13658 RepID=A0A915J754_ROMCU
MRKTKEALDGPSSKTCEKWAQPRKTPKTRPSGDGHADKRTLPFRGTNIVDSLLAVSPIVSQQWSSHEYDHSFKTLFEDMALSNNSGRRS